MRRVQLLLLILVGIAPALAILGMELLWPPGELMITWRDNTEGRAHTSIERRASNATDFVAIAMVPPGVIQYADTNVRARTTYCYRTRAVDPRIKAMSPFSDTVCGRARRRR